MARKTRHPPNRRNRKPPAPQMAAAGYSGIAGAPSRACRYLLQPTRPFVVAGLKAGQVHVLERDAKGVVTASTNEQDVVGWTMDEVLRTLMGVNDPTDDATAQAASELRQLRQEGPRASEKDEEERQQRMQELRGQVDRDLLAGGHYGSAAGVVRGSSLPRRWKNTVRLKTWNRKTTDHALGTPFLRTRLSGRI